MILKVRLRCPGRAAAKALRLFVNGRGPIRRPAIKVAVTYMKNDWYPTHWHRQSNFGARRIIPKQLQAPYKSRTLKSAKIYYLHSHKIMPSVN